MCVDIFLYAIETSELSFLQLSFSNKPIFESFFQKSFFQRQPLHNSLHVHTIILFLLPQKATKNSSWKKCNKKDNKALIEKKK